MLILRFKKQQFIIAADIEEVIAPSSVVLREGIQVAYEEYGNILNTIYSAKNFSQSLLSHYLKYRENITNIRQNISTVISGSVVKNPTSKLLKKGHEEWKKIDTKNKELKAKEEADEKLKESKPSNTDNNNENK
jgi:hypothetical protein